jgi:hypothetical protein
MRKVKLEYLLQFFQPLFQAKGNRKMKNGSRDIPSDLASNTCGGRANCCCPRLVSGEVEVYQIELWLKENGNSYLFEG